MPANDKQIGGDHYQLTIQPWDYILANNIGYCEGCAIKYISRWKKKGGVNDLKKAIHFLEKLIEKYYDDEQKAKVAYADTHSEAEAKFQQREISSFKMTPQEYQEFFGTPYVSK